MSHAGADDGKGDVVVACGSGPAMARGVGGEAERLADERAQLFQLLVVVVQSCLVLPVGLFGVGRRDDGEDVGTVGAGGQVAFQDVALGQPLLVPADEGGVYGGEGNIGAFQKGGEFTLRS